MNITVVLYGLYGKILCDLVKNHCFTHCTALVQVTPFRRQLKVLPNT